LGVIDGVIVIVGVIDGVIEMVGVIDCVGVTVGVLVVVGVIVIVGVIEGVIVIVGVIVQVIDGVGVIVAVGGGVEGITGGTTLSLLELAIDPCLITRCKDKELLRNLTFSLCKSLLLGGLGILLFSSILILHCYRLLMPSLLCLRYCRYD
jgi:hypothetical protein